MSRLNHVRATALTAGLACATAVAVGVGAPASVGAPVDTSPLNASAAAESGAAALVASRPAALHIGAHDALRALPVISVPEGLSYVPYVRTYKGLPVVGGDFVVTTNAAGRVLGTTVAQESTIGELAVTPRVGSAKAAQAAKGKLKTVTGAGRTELVVVAGGTPRLAWVTRVDGTKGPKDDLSSQSVYVDALTGAVLSSTEHIAEGTGTGAINGPNPLTLATSAARGGFGLIDPVTKNLQCGSSRKAFTSADDLWGNGVGTNLETACVDALYAAQSEVKMLSSWLGRNAMDGVGGAWRIQVGLNSVNAFYDGTKIAIGHNTVGEWIGSLDVVGHEFGHGIDDHTPGGISGNGTQEFVADVFGALTEAYTNEPAPFDVPDYLVGEEVNLSGNGPIRNMYNPSQKGHKNCYDAAIPTTQVHAAAGPGNHWFYLLAEGSNPTNGQPASSTCDGSTVTGLGIVKAGKIMYNAMLQKTTGASYLKYRVWTLNAAKNLYGCGTEFATTKAAWNAVSVPAQAGEATCP